MQIYKRKYFEHSLKKEKICTKLIFKTKEQERDFMISFESRPENFKGMYPSARCLMVCTEHFYQRPSSPMLAIKKFHQIRNEILLIFHGSINKMWRLFPIA